jgi:hypothetical protein
MSNQEAHRIKRTWLEGRAGPVPDRPGRVPRRDFVLLPGLSPESSVLRIVKISIERLNAYSVQYLSSVTRLSRFGSDLKMRTAKKMRAAEHSSRLPTSLIKYLSHPIRYRDSNSGTVHWWGEHPRPVQTKGKGSSWEWRDGVFNTDFANGPEEGQHHAGVAKNGQQ